MKLNARNQLKGTVVEIQEGAVNGIVKLDIGGDNVISSTISMAAIRELQLAVGKEAYNEREQFERHGHSDRCASSHPHCRAA